MRILLSAYACEPGVGSEAAVGWGWASHLSPKNEVHVLTRESNRERIESEMHANPISNLHFHYFDLASWMKGWKKGNTGIYLYYLLWQFGAYRLAKQLINKYNFDLVHHVTFVSARFPSFMGGLGIPFVFGPVAGGERAPPALWLSFGWRAVVNETIRTLSANWLRFSPSVQRTYFKASHIVATSPQTTEIIPDRMHHKCSEILGIALSNDEYALLSSMRANAENQSATVRIFFAGRCLYWKGMSLGLRAFARIVAAIPTARLTIIGDGPDRKNWQQLANNLNIHESVEWISEMRRDDFLRLLAHQDILLFPSLHDSGGMVVLESMAVGIPPVCLDIGGPGILVTPAAGEKILSSDPNNVINDLYDAMLRLAIDLKVRKEKGEQAKRRIEEYFMWPKKIRQMEIIYDEVVNEVKHC